MPFGFGQLSIRAESVNEEARTVEAVVATDRPVPMWDIERRALIDEVLVGRGGTFPESVPMFDSHINNSTGDVLGSGENFRLDGGSWGGTLRFDDDEPSSRAFNKVKKRFVRDVSVGYRISRYSEIEPGQSKRIDGTEYTARGRALRVATEWAGKEVSVTPIGADDAAKIRSFYKAIGERTDEDTLAERLNQVIDRIGMRRGQVIEDMAEASGLRVEEVNRVLSGVDTAPTRGALLGFAAALECELGVLLGEGR